MTNFPEASLADYLPLWHFDKDVLVYSDGSLGAAFELRGLDLSTLETQRISDFSLKLEHLLGTAPEGLRLQVLYRLESNVSDRLTEHEKISLGSSEAYATIARARLSQLREKENEGTYFRPRILFFLRGKPMVYPRQGFWASEGNFRRIAKAQYQNHKADFARTLLQVESSLSAASLFPKRLSEQEWFCEMFSYFNFSRASTIGSPQLRKPSLFGAPLTDELILTDALLHKDHIAIGGDLFRVISLKTLPDATYPSLIDGLLKLPFHCFISQTIEILDQKKEWNSLQLKRRLTHSMAAAPGNVSDMESQSKLTHIEGLIAEVLESSERILSSDLNVILWAKSQETLEAKSDEVLRSFRKLNQAEGVIETYAGFPAFIKAWPGSATAHRAKKMKTSNAAHLMPVFAYWEGNRKPVCLFPNRDHALLSIDPFDKTLPNWNGLVIGSSGAGKSFTLLQLVLMFYGQTPHPKIVWLDNGASSKNLVDCLDGQFVELHLNSPICLNPFDLAIGEKAPSPSKIKLILAMVEGICREDNALGLPKLEKALLEEAIFRTYERNERPRLSHFRDLLKSHERPELRKYAEILYSWTGNTPYGRLLDGETNIRLEKDLVAIEMRGLDIYPELQNLFLLLLTEYIQREASSQLTQNYLLIVDEAWKLLESKSGAAFTVEAYRTFRKFNAGIWAISQNINDFKKDEAVASSILQNTPSRIILKQSGVDFEDFKKVLALTDTEIEVVKSLRQEKGKFSEFLFLQDENRAIVRVEPDPLSYWICTTDPGDKARISEMKEKHPKLSTLEILQSIAEGSAA